MGVAMLAAEAQSTLILQIPTTTGYTVCADKRASILEYNAYSDLDIKIRQLNKGCGFYLVGGGDFYDKVTRRKQFLVSDIPSTFFKDHECDVLLSEDGRARFAQQLQGGLGEYLATRAMEDRPKTMYESGQPIFGHVVVFFLAGGKARVVDFVINYVQSRNVIRIAWQDCTGQMKAYGDANFFGELLNGADPKYNAVRESPVIANVLKLLRARQLTDIGAKESARFAREVIRLSSLYDTYPGMIKNAVSKTSDCVDVNNTTGITWLNKPIGGFGAAADLFKTIPMVVK